jgi:N-acetylglucosamine-6-phosphate deacetylase
MKIIDVHTHGIGGYDTKTRDPEHILKIAEIHGAHGVAEIMPTIYSSPIKEMRENIAAVKKAMEIQKEGDRGQGMGGREQKVKNSSRFGVQSSETESSSLIAHSSSLIAGIHLEGPFLNPSRYGALDGTSFLQPVEHSLKKLLDGFEDIVKIITIAPELKDAVKLIKTISDMGIIVSMGHSDATYTEAEAGFHAGAKGITHIFNAMRGFHHREPGITGFGLLNKDVYIEVIGDPYHLSPKTIELIFKVKNPKKIIIVSDSVKDTKISSTTQGLTDTHGKLLGGSITVTESAKRLIEMGFDKKVIMQCISKNPASYLYK